MRIATFELGTEGASGLAGLLSELGHELAFLHKVPAGEFVRLPRTAFHSVDALIAYTGFDARAAADFIRSIRMQTSLPILVIGRIENSRDAIDLIRLGANDYLFQDESLPRELEAALQRQTHRAVDGAAAAKVICVSSAAGGGGSSTLAANLSVLLAEVCGNCGLIDFDQRKGDLSRQLDAPIDRTLADLARISDRIDPELLKPVICRLRSNVSLLASPCAAGSNDRLSLDQMEQVVVAARQLFPVVVIDLEDLFRIEPQSLLDNCDALLLLVRPDISGFWRAGNALQNLSSRPRVAECLRVVLNRADIYGAVDSGRAFRLLGVESYQSIPDDRWITISLNLGEPIVQERPDSPAAKAMRSIARTLVEDLELPPDGAKNCIPSPYYSQRRGWLGGLSRIVGVLPAADGEK